MTATVDFVFPANHAEAVSGLLYLNGGGWTTIHRQVSEDGVAPTTTMSAVVGLTIPWTEMFHPQAVMVTITPITHGEPPLPIYGNSMEITAGPSPYLPEQESNDQHVMLAFPVTVTFPHAGAYLLTASVAGSHERKQWRFIVRDLPRLRV